MKLTVQNDPSLDACTITHDSVYLEKIEDINEWRKQLMAGVEAQIGNGRTYFLIDYTGFSVHPNIADHYGQVAEELRKRYAKDVFRYGVSNPHSILSARLQSIKRAYRSNVFSTREEAIEALNKARARESQ